MNQEKLERMQHEIASLSDNSMFDSKVHPDEAYKIAIKDVLEIMEKYMKEDNQ